MDQQNNNFNFPRKFEGISQYRPPLNFELVGQKFELVMDDGYDYELEFIDRKNLKFGKKDSELKEYAYDCLKAEEDTYFVNFEVTGAVPRAGLSIILDIEQSLVTWNYCTVGQNPKLPRLPLAHILFGAIRREDGTVPSVRHGFTRDFVGHSLNWRYGIMAAAHVYESERYYRVTIPRNEYEDPESKAFHEGFRQKFGHVLYEDIGEYIKIKDGIYAFSFTEALQNKLRGQGNDMFFLMNIDRMYDVGRSFGHRENGEPENYTFGAFGAVYEAPEVMERKSTEYIR